jgi:hypothetical protein
MDLLRSKTVTGSSGSVSVNTGLSVVQILGVFRQGEQKDYSPFVLLNALDGTDWTFVPPTRISFGTSFPFMGSEKIRILYKVTV